MRSQGRGFGAEHSKRERLAPFPVSLGLWPMWGGNRGQAHTRQAQQQQPARMAAFGRVGFSGSVSYLNSKRGKSTCLKRARDIRACLPPPFLTLGGSLNLQPTLPPGAGRGSGPAHQHKLWAGALCSWPSRADARVLECNAITGAGCWGGAQQESAWPPFPVSLGPWPMCGGKGDRRTRGKRSSSSQLGWRPLAAWAFPGRFLILTLKGARALA